MHWQELLTALMSIYVTQRVTLGPNAQMTSLSKMTSNDASNYNVFKRSFTGPQKL